jgi:hypothetical protein
MISSFYLYEDHHDHFNHHILLINKNHLIRLIKIIISIYSDQVSFKNHHLVLFYKNSTYKNEINNNFPIYIKYKSMFVCIKL